MHTGDDIGGINTNFLEVNDELPNSANNRGALNCFNICPSGEGLGDADNKGPQRGGAPA